MAKVWFGLNSRNVYRLQLLSLEAIPGLVPGQGPGCQMVPVLVYQAGLFPLLPPCILTTRNAHYLR